MATVKRILICILYWWLILGLYLFFFSLEVHRETIETVLDHLYKAFVWDWYQHIAAAAMLAALSYPLYLIIRRI